MLQENLKRIRNEKGFSLRKLANASGISLRTIIYLEKGEKSPTVNTLQKIANALNVSVSELVK